MKNIRINTLLIISLFVGCILVIRLFSIQVLSHEKYKSQAQNQYTAIQSIAAKRGDIASGDGYTLASTQTYYLLFAEPKKLVDKQTAAGQLNTIFSGKKDRFIELLNMDLYWVALQHNVSPFQRDAITKLGITGLGFEDKERMGLTLGASAALEYVFSLFGPKSHDVKQCGGIFCSKICSS